MGCSKGYVALEIIKNTPDGTWMYENDGEITVGVSTKSWLGFLIIPFGIIWIGGSVGIIYGEQIITGDYDLFKSIVGIPFLIGSIVCLKIAIMSVAGKIEVHFGKESYVFTGIGKTGNKKYFQWANWNSITRIYEDTGTKYRKYYAIYLVGKDIIEIGNWYMNFVDYHRRNFLFTTMQYLQRNI